MADKALITSAKPYFGGDPEVFLTLDGKIIGSERALPEEGVQQEGAEAATLAPKAGNMYVAPGGKIALVRDGVQIELHLPATVCRAWFAQAVAQAFKRAKKHLDQLQAEGKKFEVSFKQVVEVDQAELESLSKQSRELGCQPSFNYYEADSNIGVDPATYTKRSAGGHIHLGLSDTLKPERDRLPPLLDVLLGNTAVLVDRDPDAAERRKVYGRAGEFRRPKHGIEYRTLSNFWLRSKELVSMVTGLARLAVFVLDTSVNEKEGWPADQALMDLIDLKLIRRAINENNLELAKENFKGVRKFLLRHAPTRIDAGLDATLLDKFDHFVKRIDEKGIEFWFPTPPFEHWQTVNYNKGWEAFLDDQVVMDSRYPADYSLNLTGVTL